MTEEEAAAKLAALLNEIEAAGHTIDLWDFHIAIGHRVVDGKDVRGVDVGYTEGGFGVDDR